MTTVGVTGGIGSGKTLVCKVFENLGVPVFYADIESKKILNTQPTLIQQVKSEFGDDIYINQQLNRSKLASIVFKDKTALQKLNSMVHPAVENAFQEWILRNINSPIVIKEAAILFETMGYKKLDYTILVVAPIDIRIQRVMQRDSLSQQDVQQRINNQMSDDEKIKLANFVISNDNQKMILPQILKIYNTLTQ